MDVLVNVWEGGSCPPIAYSRTVLASGILAAFQGDIKAQPLPGRDEHF